LPLIGEIYASSAPQLRGSVVIRLRKEESEKDSKKIPQRRVRNRMEWKRGSEKRTAYLGSSVRSSVRVGFTQAPTVSNGALELLSFNGTSICDFPFRKILLPCTASEEVLALSTEARARLYNKNREDGEQDG
jgi:hypothetical protein